MTFMNRRKMRKHLKQGHKVEQRKVTVPMWDHAAKGMLWRCSCGEHWAE